jgi:hypothetical protein
MAMLFGLSLPGLAILLIVLVALERFGLYFSRVSWLPWRRDRAGLPLSAVAFNVFDAALSEGKNIELEQERVEFMMRDEDEDGAPPRSRIDLDSGVASLLLPDQHQPDQHQPSKHQPSPERPSQERPAT